MSTKLDEVSRQKRACLEQAAEYTVGLLSMMTKARASGQEDATPETVKQLRLMRSEFEEVAKSTGDAKLDADRDIARMRTYASGKLVEIDELLEEAKKEGVE